MKKNISLSRTVLIVLTFIGVQIAVLVWLGQPAICDCGYVKVWEGVVQSSGNSQHLTDWYTPAHIIHGLLFFALFTWLFPRWGVARRLFAALALEISWELIENTPMVIEHYRKQALAQGYVGDSIINSVMDTVAMGVGFFVAARVPVYVSVLIIVGFELLTTSLVRDSLLLNIINIIYPFQFIATWQSGG